MGVSFVFPCQFFCFRLFGTVRLSKKSGMPSPSFRCFSANPRCCSLSTTDAAAVLFAFFKYLLIYCIYFPIYLEWIVCWCGIKQHCVGEKSRRRNAYVQFAVTPNAADVVFELIVLFLNLSGFSEWILRFIVSLTAANKKLILLRIKNINSTWDH